MRRVILICIVIPIIVLGVIFLSNELNRANMLGSAGLIKTGEKFGISIGQNRTESERVLHANGIEKSEIIPRNPGCYQYDVGKNSEVVYYQDRTLRKGTICLAYLDGRVASIAWRYSWLDP